MLTQRRARETGRRKRSVRTQLLDAARRLYLQHGVPGVTARAVAARAGCSPTAIYLYYASVGDLLEQLRLEGHARLAERLRAVPADLPAPERIRRMGRAYWRFGLENPRYYDLMFGVRPERPGRETVRREMHTLLLLLDAVKAGIERGELRRDLDPLVATNTLWAHIHGVTALAAAGLLVETAAGHQTEVLEATLAAALRGVVPG